uniref:Solute carrier family 13 member 5-like n=1 Tax=Phallusia mammillata TaxID=59560 RepID=A0A6F9DSW7_9ASCI|nr:solute carrier family 13 member 5-like [Phallusia mammillata]
MGIGPCLQLKKFKRSIILVLTPILLLPLLIFPPPHLQTELACAYTILLMAIYWVSEVVPLAVTALLPLVFYPFLGVVTAKRTSIEYLKDVNVLFLGGLAVAVAVEHWNLHKRIALKVLTFVGAKPRWLLFGFMTTTAFLSMWISNVATTAMMIPIAQAVLEEMTTEPDIEQGGSSKSSSGGSTPPGDSNHKPIVRANSQPRPLTLENSRSDGDKVEFKPIQSSPGSNNYYTSVLQKDINKHSPTEELSNHLVAAVDDGPDASTTALIEEPGFTSTTFNTKLERERKKRNLCKALTICVCYSANIGGTATLTGTGPNLIMAGQFKTTYPHAPEIDFGSWAFFAFPGMVLYLMISWFWLQYLFLDINWSEIFPCFSRNKTKSTEELHAERMIRRQYDDLGVMSFAEKAVLFWFVLLALLWLTRDPGFVSGWGSIPIFKKGYVSDATVAMAITFILFVFPSKRPNFFCCRAKGDDSEPGPVPALLSWNVVQHKMAWNVILLLGGSFAMALGSKQSGLSQWIGQQMTPLREIDPILANFICCFIVCALTQCTSNTATATVFLPILAELGEVLGVNPLYLMLPSTVITSYAFMLPVSTPPNAIAYSYGHLTMMDMVKAGAFMNVVGIFIAMFSVSVFGGPAFGAFDPCPHWLHSQHCLAQSVANTTLTTVINSTMAS